MDNPSLSVKETAQEIAVRSGADRDLSDYQHILADTQTEVERDWMGYLNQFPEDNRFDPLRQMVGAFHSNLADEQLYAQKAKGLVDCAAEAASIKDAFVNLENSLRETSAQLAPGKCYARFKGEPATAGALRSAPPAFVP